MPKQHQITPELYADMKAWLKTPADDKVVMSRYRFGKTVVRAVRNSKDFDDYRAKMAKKPACSDLPCEDGSDKALTSDEGLTVIVCVVLAVGLLCLLGLIFALVF